MRLRRACALLASLSFVACGGVGHPAPHTIGADEDTGCPSADEALSHTEAELDGPDLDALRPSLHRIMVDEGGLRVLLQSGVLILGNVDKQTIDGLLHGIDPTQGLAKLTPHLIDVLQYVDGSSPYVPGPHEEPVAALHAVLTRCDAAETTTALRRLLALEVTFDADGTPHLAEPGQGTESWLSAVLQAAQTALDDANVKNAFQKIKLDDGHGGGIHLGKDAFETLAKLLAANFAAPNFDATYTKSLLDQVLETQITDPTSQKKLDDLLTLGLLITDPDADVFPQVQSMMQCLNAQDSNAAIPGMLYDWLTIPELSVDSLLSDVSSGTSGAGSGDFRVATVQVLGVLDENPDVARDTVSVAAKFLDADTAPVAVHTLLAVHGKGVVGELLHLTSAIQQCPR